MTFRIWKKKIVSLSYFLFVGSCFKERKQVRCWFSSRRTSLFAEKESQKDNFQAPEWLFLSKEGRSILFFFFFRHQRKKLLAFPQENRATISAFLLRNFPLRIWKDRSLILFLDDALDYLQFRLAVYRQPETVAIEKRAVYDTTFRWKANSKNSASLSQDYWARNDSKTKVKALRQAFCWNGNGTGQSMGKQISDWRAGFGKKNFPLRNDLPNLEKKNRFVILFLVCWFLLQREKQVSVLISSRRTSLFAEKESQKDNFQAPEWLFLSKEGRSILFFFFSGINGKSFSPSRRRIEQRSLPFCYETFRYESGKIVLLYYFLTMLWIISNSALPFTVSLNRCYRKRAVYDTTFRWKANSKNSASLSQDYWARNDSKTKVKALRQAFCWNGNGLVKAWANKFQIGARALAKKLSVTEWPSESGKKKIVSLSYFLFVGSCFKERNRFGADFLPEELLFLQKKSPRRTISKPQNDFSFQRKADRFCFFFFPASTEKSFSPSRRRIEQRSLPFCYETFRYESGKIVLLYYFLTMLWIISNSALPFTVSLNRCYRKRAVYDTTFRWKANSKNSASLSQDYWARNDSKNKSQGIKTGLLLKWKWTGQSMGKQISDWARGLWQKKLSVTEWPSESGKKKSFRYLISCLLVLASKRETGSVLISSRRTSLFAEKESQKDNFQAPEWLFLSKEGRSILFFFFPASTEKSFSPSRRRIEQRSLPFCYETFRYESGKIVLLYYFLTMLWIISNSALPFTVSLNRCYRKRAVYDTTFRWKANSKNSASLSQDYWARNDSKNKSQGIKTGLLLKWKWTGQSMGKQISDWRAGFGKKNFPLRNDLPNLEKKNRFVILFLVCYLVVQPSRGVVCDLFGTGRSPLWYFSRARSCRFFSSSAAWPLSPDRLLREIVASDESGRVKNGPANHNSDSRHCIWVRLHIGWDYLLVL